MSSSELTRYQIVFHRQRQTNAGRELAAVLGEAFSCKPVSPELSLRLLAAVSGTAPAARHSKKARVHRLNNVGDAMKVLESLGVWERAATSIMNLSMQGTEQSGFFVGIPKQDDLLRAFRNGLESAVILCSKHKQIFLVDLVQDDPQLGNFVEVEELPMSTSLATLIEKINFE